MERKEHQLNAIVLFSGGFDSVALYHYIRSLQLYDNIYCIYINYGNMNLEAEIQRVHHWKENYDMRFRYWNMNSYGNSSMTGGDSTGDEQRDEYVPMRNLQFLSMATAFAEVNQVRDIYFGFVDNVTFPYPDASELFINKANDLVTSITGGKISVKAPFVNMTKWDIAELILDIYGEEMLKEIFQHTITCNATDSNSPCLECSSCKSYEAMKNNFLKQL